MISGIQITAYDMSHVRYEKILGFPTSFDTNRAVQPQRMVTGLRNFEFNILPMCKNKGADQPHGTMQLICAFVCCIYGKQVFS